MLLKIVTLFLIGMVVLAMFGRLRISTIRKGLGLRDRPREAARCRHCGAPRVGSGGCPCGKG